MGRPRKARRAGKTLYKVYNTLFDTILGVQYTSIHILTFFDSTESGRAPSTAKINMFSVSANLKYTCERYRALRDHHLQQARRVGEVVLGEGREDLHAAEAAHAVVQDLGKQRIERVADQDALKYRETTENTL